MRLSNQTRLIANNFSRLIDGINRNILSTKFHTNVYLPLMLCKTQNDWVLHIIKETEIFFYK